VYLEKVPDDTTLIRWAKVIQPTTVHELLDHVVELARRLKVTKGRKLRIDGTVVATNIHYPVDSTLLEDGVRVVTRLLRRAGTVLQGGAAVGKRILDNLRQQAHQRMLDILQAARQRGAAAEASMKTAYQDLTDLTQQLVGQAHQTQRA